MKIRVNGAERETLSKTVCALVNELGLPAQTVLVELDGAALHRDEWDSSRLTENATLEILRIAAGG